MFKDAQFLTAVQKEKIVKNFKSFLKNHMSLTTFTDALYKHFSLHCGFIAHYNRMGFYDTYFTSPEGKTTFYRALVMNHEMPDYADVNKVLKFMLKEYMDSQVDALVKEARDRDVAEAKRLLAKHGMEQVPA